MTAPVFHAQSRNGRHVFWREALGYVRRLIGFIGQMAEEKHRRRELAALNETIIKDIGLSRADITTALSRPLWQPIDFAELNERRHPLARGQAPRGASKPSILAGGARAVGCYSHGHRPL